MKKHQFLQFLLLLNIFLAKSLSHELPDTYCGSIKLEKQFLTKNSSFLENMVLCKHGKLYFRTSIGLFLISSIDYKTKLLTIAHDSCSSSSKFVSPNDLSAGFPTMPSRPNSLILFNCSNPGANTSNFTRGCSQFNSCQDFAKGLYSSCLAIEDAEKLNKNFHPLHMDCTHYARVHTAGLVDDKVMKKFVLGTRISFDIPDHVPNPCNECEKKDGNCGAGLRCICHPKTCKDKVISIGAMSEPSDIMLFSLLFFVILMDFF